jgi:multidrug efflux pump subunit AcrA (membrane-fusion protein)
MPTLESVLPAHRPELLIRPLGEGQYVVKDPQTGAYYHLGAAEYFLLMQLDGRQSAEAVRAAFEQRFGEPLSADDLDDFLELARAQQFLQSTTDATRPPEAGPPGPCRQSLLYWRKSLFDPNRLMAWLAPRLRLFWTRGFLIFSAGCILLAAALVWFNRQQLATSFRGALRWETLVLAWLTMFAVTMLHEFAHGLTCKHHGGEVHEIGFLLLFFMPSFYCNVSDAWLFKEKSKLLWVTFAGIYFELFLWALAVFLWRLTLPGGLPHYLAFVVLSVCGVQTLFNFNPLVKLDGYYLLSDWAEVPNLQQRSADHSKGWLRRVLWGAARPAPDPRGGFLLTYGLASLLYALVFLAIVFVVGFEFLRSRLGWVGCAVAVFLAVVSLRSLLHGLCAGEVLKMILFRRKRTVVWLVLLGSLAAVLVWVPVEDRASGSFQVRPATRVEVRAAVAGFLREVMCVEGERVSAGTLLARLEVPDLDSRLAQKRAEVREAQARLRLAVAGPRYEELREQRSRVERARDWRDLALQDLERARRALRQELLALEKQLTQRRAELDFARASCARVKALSTRQSTAAEEHAEAEKKSRVAQALWEQARAQKQARETQGTVEAENELARRDKGLAEARASLALLEAGSRLEEIDAARARQARLVEEERYLEGLRKKLTVASPAGGLVTTPHLREKVGQYLREGDLICVIEETEYLEAEVALDQQEVSRVHPGQVVAFKARALPFEKLPGRVVRLASAANNGDGQSTVTVYCRLEGTSAALRSGMTGHARIYTGPRSVGRFLLFRVLRYLRTEFWW